MRQSGGTIEIAATTVPGFKAAAAFKSATAVRNWVSPSTAHSTNRWSV